MMRTFRPFRPFRRRGQSVPPLPVFHAEEAHFTTPLPIICKWCGSKDVMKHGKRGGIQYYLCVKCGRQFTEKDTAPKMRFTIDQIGTALTMFYEGESLASISRTFDQIYKEPVNSATVYRWVMRFTKQAIEATAPFVLSRSDRWAIDETVIQVGGKNVWFWDIIDDRSRFLVASHLSRARFKRDAITVLARARQKVGGVAPRFIISDRLNSYVDAIEQVFGADSKHIQSYGFTDEINNNLIERFHGSIKQRTKVMRGFKRMDTAYLILQGFGVNYNYFRPHMGIHNQTPADVAGVRAPFKNWTDVVRASTKDWHLHQ